MLKYSHFLRETEFGISAIPLFGKADSAFEKCASAGLLPDVVRYISNLRPRADAQYVLVNAMGAGEYFGSNVNGDYFTESSLIHRPDNWTGNPLIDKIGAKTWAYGYPTFYNAHPFAHHRNKNAARAFGEVELATWNEKMHRVELVTRVDKDKCMQFDGQAVWDKLQIGSYPDVSMGTKVPFDTCSICLDWAAYNKAKQTFDSTRHAHAGQAILEQHKKKAIRGVSITRADYCEHAKQDMNRIYPDGRKVFVYNDYPRFFDISFVFIGADRTAKAMLFVHRNGSTYSAKSSADVAEELGVTDLDEKTAKLDRRLKFRNLDISVETDKGAFRKWYDPHNKEHGETKMLYPYGYIRRSKGMDGDHVDCFVGPDEDATEVYIITTNKAPEFKVADEQKCMLGFDSAEQAKKIFQAHYTKPGFFRSLVALPYEEFETKVLATKDSEQKKIATVSDELLKLAFGKVAGPKYGEINKTVVPSQFAGKAVPILTKREPSIPKELLNLMGGLPLESSLSTTGGMGIVLRPHEFQRIALLCLGMSSLADTLESKGQVFKKSDSADPMQLDSKDYSPALAQMLLPLLMMRSALGPVIEKRVVMIISRPEEKSGKATSHPSELLDKIGSAYNGYRLSLMDIAAHAQSLLSSTPSAVELHKLGSAPVEDVFTPLSVSYLQTAFLDEIGTDSGAMKLEDGQACVERGLPSENTWLNV